MDDLSIPADLLATTKALILHAEGIQGEVKKENER
jgi:hypothetical protein